MSDYFCHHIYGNKAHNILVLIASASREDIDVDPAYMGSLARSYTSSILKVWK